MVESVPQIAFHEAVISSFLCVACCIIFHYRCSSAHIKKQLKRLDKYFHNYHLLSNDDIPIYLQRIFGGFLFGLGPFFTVTLWRYGVGCSQKANVVSFDLFVNHNVIESLKISTLILLIAIPALYIQFANNNDPKILEMYPQIGTKQVWFVSDLIFNILSWFIYLLGYEFMFRGVLLFTWNQIDSLLAISVSTTMYTLVHMPTKSIKETVACIPMGIIWSYVALQCNSVLCPLLTHLVIANVSEMFAIYFNPSMNFKIM